MLTTQSATAIDAVAVAGADLDPSLAAKLTPGDKILVEVNGTRVFSENKCPLVAETPWEVMRNIPPLPGQRPTQEHVIILAHPDIAEPLIFHYANLLHLPPRQPAVFVERDARLSAQPDGTINTCYIMLQLVSHYIPADEVDTSFEPYDRSQAKLVLTDEDFRSALMEVWVKSISTFKLPGWGQQSVFRLALRAGVTPDVIKAFHRGDMEAILSLPIKTLFRIHETLHWLEFFVCQSVLVPVRETCDEYQS